MTPSTRRRARRRRPEDRGAVLVLVLLVLVALLTIVAIVIDLAGLRLDRRESRAAADFGALAAGQVLGAGGTDAAVHACERAAEAVAANLDAAGPSTGGCAALAGACSPGAPREVVLAGAGYQLRITYPVPDGHRLMTGTGGSAQAIVPAIDGTSCERIGVEITRQRDYFFGQVVGIDGQTTTVHSVGRGLPPPPSGQPVALLVLEHTRCNALTVQGNGFLSVDQSDPLGGVRSPGFIAVDSDGSGCSPGGFTIDAQGNNSRISAGPSDDGTPGRIALYAMTTTTCSSPACDPSDVSSGRVAPQPVPVAQRFGRTRVDHRYNCKPVYNLPAPWTGAVPGCTGAPAYIDALVASYQSGGAPAGFRTYPAEHPGGTCDLGSSAPPVVLDGNWFVDCPTLQVRTGFHIIGNGVFAGNVNVTGNSGRLQVGTGSSPAVMYVRSGSVSKNGQATVVLDRTTLYLRDGIVNFTGGTGSIVWRGPTSGNLEGLALWSERAQQHILAGQSNTDVFGVFFAPNAGYGSSLPFRIAGNGSQVQLRAQFITYRLEVTGNGRLTMVAPPYVTVPTDQIGIVRLIR